jgi:deoxyadenosine/deoxycytidine kinase
VRRPRFLVVEGPIGVGKTSLVQLLAPRLGAATLLESAEENPFLVPFYRDMRRHAFQAQIFFLLHRYRQQQDLAQFDLFRQTLISDYLFAKDKIFAYLTLDEYELALYEKVQDLLEVRVPRPDLVIYLQAATGVLQQRIALRGKPFERGMDRQYLEDLNSAYNHFFFHYDASPLLVVNTNELDFVNRKQDLEDLVKQIHEVRGGTHYYVPLTSSER